MTEKIAFHATYVRAAGPVEFVAMVNKTIVVVEQNVATVLSFADRVYGFNNDHFVPEGHASALRTNPASMRGIMGLAA